ncbi:MAG TPA: hypothetical protein VKU00_32580 [Chthonomonadaceae bacterium]|nr:hypothetical protein [Chthonomonadaceae bacterium]
MQKVQIRTKVVTYARGIFIGVVVTMFLYMILFSILPTLPYRVPPYVAARATERVSLLRPGMTEQQVWSTLGLSGRGFKAHIGGSGSPAAFPANYALWPGHVLHMRWNYKTKPATLVDAEAREHL